MENKTKFFKTLIVPISIGVILWQGQLYVGSDQNINTIQSNQEIGIASKNLNSNVKLDKNIVTDEIIELENEEIKNLESEISDDVKVGEEETSKDKEDSKGIEIESKKENIDTSSSKDKELNKIEEEIKSDSPDSNQNQNDPKNQTTQPKSTDNSVSQSTNLNKYVLNIISTYPTGTTKYPYLLNTDYANYNGVTENIYYNGEILAKAHPSGVKYSHCSGITFEVFFKAMQTRNKALGISTDNFNNMSKDQLFDFLLTWYAANGPKSQSNIAVAVEKYGVGKKITNLENAIPGDFIDISRTNNTGHTMVFINWIKEGDNIVGLRYWSSQQSTNGISYKEEYFNVKRSNGKVGNVIKDQVYIARVF